MESTLVFTHMFMYKQCLQGRSVRKILVSYRLDSSLSTYGVRSYHFSGSILGLGLVSWLYALP